MLEVDNKTVLISQPQLMDIGLPYLPVMWGILKTYWERNATDPERINWLMPLNHMVKASTLLRPYQEKDVDVLGLSCYTWNWNLQCQIAQAVKAGNPHCLVVAGGPEPDYKDPDFFKKHPYIDMIAVKDGEITFTNILQQVLKYDTPRDLLVDPGALSQIRGLYLPGNNGEGHSFTGPADVPTEFPYSPYIEQSAHYEKMRKALGPGVCAVWETNRGCPFRCSFCDWGSNTMSKVRKFDMDRVRAEIEWFGRMQVGYIMSADANFGMLPRDLEIVDLLIEANEKYGTPFYFTYNTAKNNPDRTVAVAKKLLNSGLISSHVLSIQHTNPNVLAATERANISTAKQYQVARELMEEGVPIYVQLILGIPGDTLAYWKGCFADLMEWGIHTYYWVFPYNLLPNAPAAEPDYVAQWEIETADRYVLLNHGIRPRGQFDPVSETKSRLIVKTKTFSQDDWVEMNTYTVFIKALHNSSVTHSIAIYLRFTHNVPYSEFYEDLYEHYFKRLELAKGWCETLDDHHRDYLVNDDAILFMDIPQLPAFDYQLEPSCWLYVQICLQLEQFFESLCAYLVARYPEVSCLESVIGYQKELIILPSYDRQQGKTFCTDYDWITYFAETRKHISYVPMAEPEPIQDAVVTVGDQEWADARASMPLTWTVGDHEACWMQWIQTMVTGRTSSFKNNFQQLALTSLADTVA